MHSVADLVEEQLLAKLATPANLRLGKEIAANDRVEIVEFSPVKVVAKVKGENTRTVHMNSTKTGLVWECTCTKNEKLFCKHCVATAIVTWDQSPKRRS